MTHTADSAPAPADLPDAVPLAQCVREALHAYLARMGDHEILDLHALVMDEVERPLLELVLHHTQGNLSQAAVMLGMTRTTLRKRLARHGLR